VEENIGRGNSIEEILRSWCNNVAVKGFKALPLIIAWRIFLTHNGNIFNDIFSPHLMHHSKYIYSQWFQTHSKLETSKEYYHGRR
jgi:hypothetical protein